MIRLYCIHIISRNEFFVSSFSNRETFRCQAMLWNGLLGESSLYLGGLVEGTAQQKAIPAIVPWLVRLNISEKGELTPKKEIKS